MDSRIDSSRENEGSCWQQLACKQLVVHCSCLFEWRNCLWLPLQLRLLSTALIEAVGERGPLLPQICGPSPHSKEPLVLFSLMSFTLALLGTTCSEKLARLGAHVEIASKLNQLIEQNRLAELGKLEQDLVYGDATSKEVINFLSTNQTLPAADKVRLRREWGWFSLCLWGWGAGGVGAEDLL